MEDQAGHVLNPLGLFFEVVGTAAAPVTEPKEVESFFAGVKHAIVNGRTDVKKSSKQISPGIPTTIKTMGVNITTIVYLRVLIIQIGSTIILMVVEA